MDHFSGQDMNSNQLDGFPAPPGIDRALPAGSRRRHGGNVCAVFLEIAVVLVVFMDICS